MLPDYIIYDELRRREQLEETERRRPQLEIPRYVPYWPDVDREEGLDDESDGEGGVIIIQM